MSLSLMSPAAAGITGATIFLGVVSLMSLLDFAASDPAGAISAFGGTAASAGVFVSLDVRSERRS